MVVPALGGFGTVIVINYARHHDPSSSSVNEPTFLEFHRHTGIDW